MSNLVGNPTRAEGVAEPVAPGAAAGAGGPALRPLAVRGGGPMGMMASTARAAAAGRPDGAVPLPQDLDEDEDDDW